MKQRMLKICICCLMIALVVSGTATVISYYKKNRPNGDVRGLNEYNRWESNMIKENPDYNNLRILIDISEKRLYLLNGSELIKKYPIASGRPGHPSPIGSWKVVNKAKWGGGFGTRWMGLNVPWSVYQQEYGIG
ncbi:L,D-transpeptidase [Alkaliphilus hydrothermalis]|uniref:L,D-TPase catalytic domain-containing protein n=1 Tax=Alkaliphilus hydrothermalis TaxID=1482730 RepID=A0ABS2NT77_9FIRM|nr:hypothetical protein [Alkaliphilus hydrothermalis]